MASGMSGLCKRWTLLLLAGLSVTAVAETLPDPTRPPGGLFTAAGQNEEKDQSGLQSVIIAPGRRAAIINGQTVELGDKLGDDRLIEVTERGVVLRGKHGRLVMTMFPGVEMKRRVAPQSLTTKPLSAAKKPEKKAAADAVPQEDK